MIARLAALVAVAVAACSAPVAPRAPGPAAPVVCPAPAPAPDPAAPAPAPPPTAPARTTIGALTLDGIPGLAEDLRPAMTPFLEVRTADVLDVSDDGRRLLIATRFGERRQLHEVAQPGGDRTQRTFGSEPVLTGFYLPGTTDVIFASDRGGDERYQLYRLDGAGVPDQLTAGDTRNVNAIVADDGATLAWASNARNGTDFDLWIGDGRRGGAPVMALELAGSWVPQDWSADGRRLLLVQELSVAESHLHVLDRATGQRTQLSAPGRVSHPMAAFAPDGTVWAVSDRDGEFRKLYRVSASGAWTAVGPDGDGDVEQLAIAPDGKTVVVAVNRDGVSELLGYEVGARRWRPVGGAPAGGVIGTLRFARKAPVLAFSWGDGREPGDAYTIDLARGLARGALTRWTTSELGGLDRRALVTAAIERVPSFDGRAVPVIVYRPPGAGPFPTVIDLHGGPESQVRPRFAPFVQFLVARGYAVVQPNVRGSTGYGKTYTSLDDGQRREDAVRDVGAVLDWIAREPALDETRVAVTGRSYGGYLVLASLIHHGARLRAGVDVVGISSFVTFLEATSPYRRDLRRVEYGDERDPAMRAFLERIAPLARAREITSALFVAQGENDPRVPPAEAAQIVAAVRAAGRPVWYLTAADEGHDFTRRDNRDALWLLTARFLDLHLAR